MAFTKKTWVDRMVEFAGRRKLTNVSNSSSVVYDVERAEGVVQQEGTAFSAANMNDLETRIANAITATDSTVTTLNNNFNQLSTQITDYTYYADESEKVVGKWIDGRTIYRRLVKKHVVESFTQNKEVLLFTDTKIDWLINTWYAIHQSAPVKGSVNAPGFGICLVFHNSSNNVIMRVLYNWATSTSTYDLYVMLDYVKKV